MLSADDFCPRFLVIVLFVTVLLWTPAVHADTSAVVPLDFTNDFNVSEALVGFISFATTPGISSASLELKWPEDQQAGDLDKTSIELEFDIDLRSRYFKLFTGIGFNHISLKDNFRTENLDGDPVFIEPDRDLYAGRLSGGLTFQVTPYLRATPYVSIILSELDSKTTIRGDVDLDATDPDLRAFLENFKTKSTTLAGTLELEYDRWFERRRIELFGRYTYNYTETFDETEDFLISSGDVNVIDFEGRWSAPTGLRAFGVPLRWKLIGGYTHLLDLDKEAIGFRYFFEYGGGFDLEVDVQPLGLVNLRNIGLNLVGITGDDLTGWSFGISLTN